MIAKKNVLRAALLASLALAALAGGACSSAGGGSGTSEYGGAVSLVRYDISGSISNFAAATFLSSAGEISASASVALDTCSLGPAAMPSPSPTASVTPRNLDAGSVTLTSGATTLSLTDAGGFIYQAQPATIPLHTTWSMTIAGGADLDAQTHADVLDIPGEPLTVTNLAVPAGGEITWNAAGGDAISLLFYDGATPVASCTLRDDGAFTLPVNITSALPASGYLYFLSTTTHAAKIQGRTVFFYGYSGNLVNYTH